MKKYLFILLSSVVLISCGPTKSTKYAQYPSMYSENPKTILIIPPVNNTTAANGKDLLRTTITTVLSDKGYYVLPIEPIFDFFKMNGAYSIAETSEKLPLDKFSSMFGADAVMKVTLMEWDRHYYVVSGNVEVEIKYELISTKTGKTLWTNHKHLKVDTSSSSGGGGIGGMVADLAATAVATATTKYVDVAAEVHKQALLELPEGFYSKRFGQDKQDVVILPKEDKKKS